MNATNIKNLERKEVNSYYLEKKADIIYGSNNRFYNILEEWIDYLELNEYAIKGIYAKKRHMSYFLNYLETCEIKNLNQITSKTIINYLNSFPKYYRKQTLKTRCKELRVILRFLYQKNYISDDLSSIVPSIKSNHLETIPSVWKEDDIKKIFDTIDTSYPSGRRLYAVLLLAIKYGMRVGDIKLLQFENIDWKNKQISFIQSKTMKEVKLPLLPEVADAIIDYIKNARPNSKERIIFLDKNGNKLKPAYNFYTEIRGVMKKANLEYDGSQKKGIHSLRHTLASTLLKKDVSYYIISTILGHKQEDSTFIYAKIDENKLIQCCLELPEVKL